MSSKEEILKDIERYNIRYISMQFTGLDGFLKNVEIPVSQIDKALENECTFDGSSINGFARITESDMLLYPDLSTWLVYPFVSKDAAGNEYRTARFICDVYLTSRVPFEGDPRYILRQSLKKMEAAGFDSFNIGPEPEFFLFKIENGEITKKLNDNGGYFDIAPVDEAEDCRRDIVVTLEALGFDMEASHHEVAQGQHEIDFKYAEALKAADQIQTFKLFVKIIAKKHGYHASFMPKPVQGINGSGMHLNTSLFKNGKNAFYDETTEDGLSEVARRYIAGIMRHAREFAMVTNPTVNSYKRLVPGYEAPCYIAWSTKNRSTLIRIPAARGNSTRVELRCPDPAANPYLAIAAVLSAGLKGLTENYDIVNSYSKNLFRMTADELEADGITSLPTSLRTAAREFKASALMKEVFGEHAFNNLYTIKEAEAMQYQLQVSDWEWNQYVGL